ncbi:MAG: ethanolamine ammonia-lyase reactivating factor EutA [Chloroflexi bacterium]|nr:ethanolamine ammonia-lyase reactivating factor EutA [Chloroflexota bacterium]
MNDTFHDHDHEHEDHAEMPLEEDHPLWAKERIELRSVGIDIGSSTSHLMFSRLVLRRLGMALSSKFIVVSREVTYESPIMLTPFLPGNIIDIQALSLFVDQSYHQAGIAPDKIDTGAVIITGDAARKDNAEAIANMFSRQAGKFVCATAGPNLEAQMAVFGSGVVDKTGEGNEAEDTGMNVDVGGGTAKLAIAQRGAIVDTSAMNVGARLVVFDEHGCIVKTEEAGRIIAEDMGVELKVGQVLKQETKQEIASRLADCLFNVVSRKPLTRLTQKLMITSPLSFNGKVGFMTFSGGVSEYVYSKESQVFGDLGPLLGAEIRKRASQFPVPMQEPACRIRATVIGASQYTVQVSGNTIFISEPGLLPLRNLQVVTPHWVDDTVTKESVAQAFGEAFRRYDLEEGDKPVALALHWPWGPSYPLLQGFAQGLLEAMKSTIARRVPMVLVFDADLGKLIGNNLAQELPAKYPLLSIDGVDLKDFDFIDIGEEITEAQAVPVVIKSLIFRC